MRRWYRGNATIATVLAGLAAAVGPVRSQSTPPDFEVVEFAVGGERAATLKAYLRRPADTVRGPAVVALHGCGGLFGAKGNFSARELDWAARLVSDGYAVLFPDSFNPRGYREICRLNEASRPMRPRHRADDAVAARTWLAQQSFVDPARIAILGWSHGGSSTLWAARQEPGRGADEFKTAIAFYPGCRPANERADYQPSLPLTILIGSADDWTPPEPCRDLARRHSAIRLIEYPGAVHGFDAPNSPRRTRRDVGMSGAGAGQVQVGTDPVARAAALVEVRRILAEAFGLPQKKP